MRAKWMVGVAVLTLGVAAAVAVLAQDRPSEPPRGGGEDRQAPRGIADVGDPMQDMDGLDMLLAGDLDADAAQGPGGTMGAPASPGMRGMGRGGAAREELRKQLKLTEEQKNKLADIRDRSARAAIPLRGDIEVAGLDMRKLMRADKPDQRAIDAQIDKMAGLRAKLQKSRVAGMLEARSVLTPDQQKILRDARPGMMGPGMRGRMRGMHDMHGQPGMDMDMGGHGTNL